MCPLAMDSSRCRWLHSGAHVTRQSRAASEKEHMQAAPEKLCPVCRPVTDFRFPLMRHWSVYESIIHSRYVAVRLGTWQDKGRDKVDELLVKMGLSQRDCKQDYCAPSCLCPHGTSHEKRYVWIRY